MLFATHVDSTAVHAECTVEYHTHTHHRTHLDSEGGVGECSVPHAPCTVVVTYTCTVEGDTQAVPLATLAASGLAEDMYRFLLVVRRCAHQNGERLNVRTCYVGAPSTNAVPILCTRGLPGQDDTRAECDTPSNRETLACTLRC